MHIPFVIYDGYLDEQGKMANIVVDGLSGGELVGKYLLGKGHHKVLCISDNDVCMDLERYQGLKKVLPEAELLLIPMQKEEREKFYRKQWKAILQFTAVFAVSDYYAVDLMNFLKAQQVRIPDEISIVGFDDTELGKTAWPALTTVRQDSRERAREALKLLAKLKDDQKCEDTIKIKVSLVERNSVKELEQKT